MSEPRFDSLYSAWTAIAGGTGYDSTYSAMKAALEKVTGQENYDSVYSIAADFANDVESGSASVAKNTQLNEEITENGTYTFTPDEGYVYDSVTVSVDAGSKAEGTIKIVNNGTYDVTTYAKANVAVGGEALPKIPNGFRFTGGDLALVDFGAYDWSMVYDTAYFFQGCTHSTGDWSNFEENFNGSLRSTRSMFANWNILTSIPQLNTSNVVDMGRMFYYGQALTSIPQLNTSNVVDMSYMFYYCDHLHHVPPMDTSKVEDMGLLFSFCKELEEVPDMDTPNVVNMSQMFFSCYKLKSIPSLNMSKVRNLDGFCSSTAITEVPPLDTRNVTRFGAPSNTLYGAFSNCTDLKTVHELDLSSARDAHYMFLNCHNLEVIRFKGNPSNLSGTSGMFDSAGSNVESCTLYYDSRYDYSKIISLLPSNWVAVPYDVNE